MINSTPKNYNLLNVRTITKLILKGLIFIIIPIFFMSFSENENNTLPEIKDTIITDSLIFPFDDYTNSPSLLQKNSPLFLKNPRNIISSIKYDAKSGNFIFYDKIGNFNYRSPYYLSFNNFLLYTDKLNTHQYWMERSALENAKGETSLIDKLVNQNLIIPIQGFDKVFGTNTISIKPQGTAELIFGVKTSHSHNPSLPANQQKSVNFDFDMNIKMGVNGQIGDKMKLGINFDTDATFEFENNVKLAYEGKDDEIIQRIEAGNVSMPLSGSLITGSHSLFGLKTELKFGNLVVTTLFSQQKGESKTIEISGGATTTPFEITADNYDAGRHFFISQYFRDRYDIALKNLPIIRSNINIRKIEVWITNRSANLDNSRNIIAFMDLAENSDHLYSDEFTATSTIPSNETNNLYALMNSIYSPARNVSQANTVLSAINNFNAGIDYEILQNARLLSPSEYTFNANLGYISLNMQLNNDEVLAVAFEYENTEDGEIYQVGEFSTDEPQAPSSLYVKLLKPTTLSTELPTWDLMMKNVYTFNAYQVNSQDFRLDVMYRNDKTGSSINYIPDGDINGNALISVMGLDNLNKNNEPGSDGFFDFIDRITINSTNGRIYFPVVEPFGSYLKEKITGGSTDPELNRIAEQYIFQELYDQTQSQAQQAAEKNKFFLKGEYRSAGGSEINLNAMNIPQGSVKVTAGGAELIENRDYSVDYNLGRVTIINESYLNSGTPISISLESNSMFNIGTKSLIGTHFDYKVSENLNIGGTIMHLHQKPLTTKVSIGNEPISNTIWGANFDFNKELPFLTRFVDKFIPFVETKAPSNFDFNGEFAQLIPGHPKILSDEGYAHIDDFEGATVKIDLKSPTSWKLSSTPHGQPDMFPEADSSNTLSYGFNRAKLAWYTINRDFQGTLGADLGYSNDDLSNHYVREIPEKEIFPDRDPEHDVPQFLYVMNLAYYPDEKGPFNYDVDATDFSSGINASGLLNNPETRWAGIMRSLTTNNFEEANIEFIEFWLLDPFIYSPDQNGGELYFNLGNVSEDILRDSRQMYENGLPESANIVNVDSTVWGRVPMLPRITDAFTASGNNIQFQDAGLDGLTNNSEISFFENYLNNIRNNFSDQSQAYQNAKEDRSSDDFKFWTHPSYNADASILDRHKNYNNTEGNSVPFNETTQAPELSPDMEDLNRDFTMSENEAYFQYKVHIDPDEMEIGQNYITDIKESTVTLRNENVETVKWYHFKIPLEDYENVVGPIQDFKSIRFVRLFMKNWDEEVVLRFASMDMVRGDWRKYRLSLLEGSENAGGNEITDAQLDISTVNIEENSSKEPVNYILPPGVSREISPSNPYLQQLNEQSLSLNVYNLSDGDARAAYKNLSIDVRQFKKIQLFVHAEAIESNILNDDDLTVFVRLGADYQENYYEYEIPLKLTEPGYYDPETENESVWPEENMLDLNFEILQAFKQKRNEKVNAGLLQLTSHYSEFIDESGRKISIIGSPNLSNVRTIMIGIRNRKKENNILADDGLPKSIEVWVNELRLAGFNEEGGWATRGRLQSNLADFSTLAFAGQYSTPGFGSIEKNVNERQKSTDFNYDFSSTTELGKFFPQKYGVRVPVYFGYSEIISNPEYDPLNPDIKMTAVLKNMDQKERNEYLKNAQDYQKIKSFNLTNIRINGNSEKKNKSEKDLNKIGDDESKKRKDPTGNRSGNNSKPLWHISNWTLSYGLNETLIRNINTEHNLLKIHNGSIAYNYSITPKNVKPFDKVKLFKYKAFKIIKDFNFYYTPSLISFRTDLRKSYNEIQLRNVANPLDTANTPDETYDKQFTWNRNYDVNYSLTRNLKFIYNADNQAWINEPDGKIDKDNKTLWESYKNEVIDSLSRFGRTNDFHQRISGVWNVPIKDLPLLYWTSANVSYDADYYWTRNPIALDDNGDTINLGNTVRNNQNLRLSGQLNFESVYNKVKRLKEVDQKFKSGKKKDIKKFKTVTFEKKGVSLKKDKPKSITHNLKTENITVKAVDSNGKEIKGKFEIVGDIKARFISEEDAKDVIIIVEGKKEEKNDFLREVTDYTLYTLMSVRNVSLNYSQSNGTVLPGFMRSPSFFGMDDEWNAPGWEFILGIQDDKFAKYAFDNGWLSTDSLLNTPVVYTNLETYDFRAVLKPFNGLKIDVDATRRQGNNIEENWSGSSGKAKNRYETGSFSMSFFSIKTAFGKIDTINNEAYQKFLSIRKDVAWQLANDRLPFDNAYNPYVLNNSDSSANSEINTYPFGYKSTSKDVLLESFLTAYAGQNPNKKYGRNPFPAIPMPNWRIKYDGLTYFDFIKRVFKKVTIDHAYKSTYSVISYNIDSEFEDNEIGGGFSHLNDSNYFASKYQIDGGVTINEIFAPLFGIDVKWNNDMSTKFEYKQSRTMTLSFSNNQILETASKEFIIGFGYKIPNLEIPLSIQGTQRLFKSDLNFRFDFTYRDAITVIRRISENENQASAGQSSYSLRVNADYNLDKITMNIFYNYDMTDPIVSTTYKTSNTYVGFSLRFNLANL